MNQKTCIIISGPTAVGKTAFALDIASRFATEIISADSRQCFKELNIGVAKPSPLQLSSIPHHFIDLYSIVDEVNAKIFEGYALEKATHLFKQHEIIVIAGGTGLYLKAFTEGLDEIPPIDITIQKNVIQNYEMLGLQWLQQELKQLDPDFAMKGEMLNPHRMIRALSVKMSTGKSILAFQTKKIVERPFNMIKIGLELPKRALHENINRRVDQMVEEGLINEVKSLQQFKTFKALQTVGYTEIFNYLDGHITQEKAIDLIKLNTRHYAKRQMTWFKKDEEIKWFDASCSAEQIHNYIKPLIRFS